MSDLTVYLESDARRPELRTADPALITGHLAHAGILFERWTAEAPLPASADADAVLAAYAASIERLKEARRFCTVDVVRITLQTDGVAALRAKFLDEHIHEEDEARFFVEGTGAFYIHLDSRVFRVVCGAGDLLSIPAGTPHWFDMGAKPRFTTIRFFSRPDGWVATPTGDAIAARFPFFQPDAARAA
ncbi:1,2-dihydroxy-3-keto-5-methylthiopentene dioxygenase [Azospirillum lipoferum]|uniref:Acireductone dioxygenase n=1 Tax=Azospirillum lipoferum TaxID=193 RepID=A0A5A9GG96_AZOLI|nr:MULTISPECIES: cupin domain-containing protein [Azospirillum]KAA0593451.1 cupin domain-containing protein [Azospirillum lipoferum]MCP1609097.1 1,2-dihydroxy-3-keto-5-methylthiopentene dioxygenase [Azospirillum lipoferum]MDW5535591.1 cupin domain-containing protein [Azospirillum sp. NL1]